MPAESMQRSSHWWKVEPNGKEADPAEVHDELWGHVKTLWIQDSSQRWADRIYDAIYDSELLRSSGPYSQALSHLRRTGFDAARLNVSRSAVDTVVGKIGKNRPAIKTNPADAQWSLRKKARLLTRFTKGKMEALEVQDLAPEIVRDACVIGTGITQVGHAFGEIVIDRVPREEMIVDAKEARYGKPRQIHRTRQMAREVVMELFPHAEIEIKDAQEADSRDDENYEGDSNMIDVFESWHLPSSPEANDGRHAMIIDGCTLLYEEYDKPYFPFALMRYTTRRRGFWGRGLVQDGAEIQHSINDTVRDIQQSLYFGAQLRVWVRRGQGIVKQHLGRQQRPFVVEHDGIKPEYDAPNPVSSGQVQYLEMMIQRYYDLVGVSQMSASAKPALSSNASAVALQEIYDLETERLSTQEQSFARWWVDLAKMQIDVARDLHESKPAGGGKWNNQTVVDRIPWGDVDMAHDQYSLTLEPSNFLPDTRAGKLEAAGQLVELGILSGPELSYVMGSAPDLDKVNRLRNGPMSQLDCVMEKLGDEDEDVAELAPDAHMDLALGLKMAKAELASAFAEGAPPEVLQRFREWISLAREVWLKQKSEEAEMAAAVAPPPEMMPPEMMPPGGAPMGPEGMPPALPPGPEGAPPPPPMPMEMPQ
jgi:hypothetical protein